MNLKEFWNNSGDQISHLNLSNDDINYVISLFNTHIDYDFNGKEVIEYGVGSGYITNFILNNYDTKRYQCIDINDRCLKEVKKLGVDVRDVPKRFRKADVFLCLATIQHFPTEEYLLEFLDKLNKSKIKTLYLQIREGEKQFKGNLENENSMYKACVVPTSFITEHLPNFELTNQSKTLKENNYKYLTYERRN